MSVTMPAPQLTETRPASGVVLRAIDPQYYALMSQLRPAERDSPHSEIVVSKLSPEYRYLHLSARDLRQGTQAAFDVYWPVADVCRQLFGDDRIAPQWVAPEMIEAIAMDWSCAEGWRFGLDDLHIAHVVGVIDGRDCRHFLFAHTTPVGTLLMSHSMGRGNRIGTIRLPAFPLPLVFRAGHTHLDRAQLLSLRSGDVVRLMALAPSVLLDGTHLCNVRFDGDTLVVEGNDDSKRDRGDRLAACLGAPDSEGVAWDQLTMTCDFVLPMRRYKLAELDQMHEGAILPMDPRALTEVEMCVGKQVVAVGELVQIGELVGFEVKRMLIKPGAPGDAEPGSERKRER